MLQHPAIGVEGQGQPELARVVLTLALASEQQAGLFIIPQSISRQAHNSGRGQYSGLKLARYVPDTYIFSPPIQPPFCPVSLVKSIVFISALALIIPNAL